MPKATQSGANIMAAKINGKKWEAGACWSCFGGGSGLTANYNPGNISGVKGEQKNEHSNIVVRVYFYDITKPGTYVLGLRDDQTRIEHFAEVSFYHESKYYITTGQSKGTLTITKLDINAKIMSGTFELTAEDKKDPTSTIKVTDGRFDVKL